MGMLVDGVWTDRWYDTAANGGRFVRSTSVFRRWTTRGNAVAPDGRPGVPAERGRYLLIVSHACPWAHRTLILRALKGLEDHIPLAVVHWRMLEEGWTFEPGPGVVPPPIPGVTRLYEVYTRADPTYTGRVTVPVLYDLSDGTIVNNESSEIIRMLNGAFDDLGGLPGDYSPEHLRTGFDAVYVGHFKCNLRRIADYPALSGYVREIYQHPAIRPIVHFDHIKGHYYESHRTINPTGIVPLGPVLDLDAPHGRDGLPGLRL